MLYIHIYTVELHTPAMELGCCRCCRRLLLVLLCARRTHFLTFNIVKHVFGESARKSKKNTVFVSDFGVGSQHCICDGVLH